MVAHALVIRLLQHAALRRVAEKSGRPGCAGRSGSRPRNRSRNGTRPTPPVDDLLLVEFQLLRDLRKILSGARAVSSYSVCLLVVSPQQRLGGAPSHAARPVAHPAGQRFHPSVRAVTITQSSLMKSLVFGRFLKAKRVLVVQLPLAFSLTGTGAVAMLMTTVPEAPPTRVLHVDGDTFFASCEIAMDASLSVGRCGSAAGARAMACHRGQPLGQALRHRNRHSLLRG